MANMSQPMPMNQPMNSQNQFSQPQNFQTASPNPSPNPNTGQNSNQNTPEDKNSIKGWMWFMIGLLVGIGASFLYFYLFAA